MSFCQSDESESQSLSEDDLREHFISEGKSTHKHTHKQLDIESKIESDHGSRNLSSESETSKKRKKAEKKTHKSTLTGHKGPKAPFKVPESKTKSKRENSSSDGNS